MRRHLVEAAVALRRPLDEVTSWDVDTLATFLDVWEEQIRARR